jgi:nitrogen-specific signal transduction histidine kinase/ActR/RegA family two-component response regulator
VLNTIEANTRTEDLLKQSQLLAAELQNRQEELEKTNLELQEKARSNLAKDQFLAMLSHELRTPLTPVLTSVLTLEQEESTPATVRESLQMIHRNVELEAKLIDDLLDLTRISQGKVQLNLETVDAHQLIQSAVDICQGDIEQKNLDLRCDLTASEFHLKADRARLQQIFWNLIKNAIKFTPPRGQISIFTANDSGGRLRIEVEDTGVGIEPEALPKIFDAFEQGGRTQLGGLGLGLAISKALADAHNGTIKAESDGQNQGAKFTLVFPTCEKTDHEAQPAISTIVTQRRPMRVLLVEDHLDTNRSLTKLLQLRGYSVRSATTIAGGVELAGSAEFDVLISDLGLPDGKGFDLLQKLGPGRRPALTIALTGFGMEEDIRRSLAAGFKHHLVKPIDLNKLDLLIQQSVGAVPEQRRDAV